MHSESQKQSENRTHKNGEVFPAAVQEGALGSNESTDKIRVFQTPSVEHQTAAHSTDLEPVQLRLRAVNRSLCLLIL